MVMLCERDKGVVIKPKPSQVNIIIKEDSIHASLRCDILKTQPNPPQVGRFQSFTFMFHLPAPVLVNRYYVQTMRVCVDEREAGYPNRCLGIRDDRYRLNDLSGTPSVRLWTSSLVEMSGYPLPFDEVSSERRSFL